MYTILRDSKSACSMATACGVKVYVKECRHELGLTTIDNGTTPISTAILPQIRNRHRKIGLSKVPQSETNSLGPRRNGSITELIPAPGLLTAVKPTKHTKRSKGSYGQKITGQNLPTGP